MECARTQAPQPRMLSITLSRVISMIFIVICHLGDYWHKSVISQFFNVGVYLFFLISGFLYGNRKITDWKSWIVKRLIRIYVPLLLWDAVTLISGFIRGKTASWTGQILLLFNLQGFDHIVPGFPTTDGPWFFTVIMLCYWLTIPAKNLLNGKKLTAVHVGALTAVYLLLNFTLKTNLSGILAYFVGWYIANKGIVGSAQTNKRLGYCLLSGALAVVVRLAGKKLADGTAIYNAAIVPLTHIVLAVSILLIIDWLIAGVCSAETKECGVLKMLDRQSIYVYISHPWIYNGTLLSVFSWGLPLAVSLPLFAVLVICVAQGLMVIGSRLSDKLNQVLLNKR